MHRRTALAGAGTALTLALAGCVQQLGDANADDPSAGDADRQPDGPAASGPNDNDSDTGDDSDAGDEDAVPVLTDFAVSDEAVQPDVERTSDMDAWGAFIASHDAAVAAFGQVDADEYEVACEFLDETDFEAGDRLVYVEAYAPQLCYELRPAAEPAVADNGITQLPLEVNRTAPPDEACGDAITAVDLLLRLSFDLEAADPDVVTVHVAGHRDQAEELVLEAAR